MSYDMLMGHDRKWWKTLLKVILWFVGIWTVLLLTIRITLSEKVLTKIVNRYAAEYIEGEVSFGSASVSVFKYFPRIFLTLEDFHITYPADRFDEAEKLGAQGHLMHRGCSEIADTLASFDRFSASLNLASLMGGTIRIPHLRLVHPRIFAHTYANGESNLDILKISSETEEDDTTSLTLPKISLGRISLSRHPHIVYTDSRDTVFAMIDVARIGFTGQLSTNVKSPKGRKPRFGSRNMAKGLTIDSLMVAGRVKKDTVALALNRLYVQDDNGIMNIDGKARAMLATRSAGRIHLPISITGQLDFPKDSVPAISLRNFKANVGDFPIVADADVRLHEGKAAMKAKAGVKDCQLNDVFHGFATNIIPELKEIETDARLTMLAECNGDYDYTTGQLPKLTVSISLPEANFKYSELDKLQMKVGIAAGGYTDNLGKVHAVIDSVTVLSTGLDMNIKGNGKDLTGANPSIDIDGYLHASLDSLVSVLPDTLGIIAKGDISGRIHGNALLSQLSIYNFSYANIVGDINSDQIVVQMPSDSIDVDIKGLDIFVGPEERVSRRDSTRSFRLAGATMKIKQGKILYGSALSATAGNLFISAKNSVNSDASTAKDSTLNPLSGRFNAEYLIIKDAAGAVVNLTQTNNSFMMRPKKDQPKVPILSLTSRNKKITLSQDRNRAVLSEANLKARAEMNTVERRQKAKAYRDSLANVYPDIPRDSLLRHAFSQRSRTPMPEWLQEEDFKKQDIDIRLDETMAKYFRDWDINGQISVKNGYVITPYFPVNNALKGFELNFTNNEIKVDTLKLVSGRSELEMKGKLSGLRRALLGRSNRNTLKLNLDISSGMMNASELMAAYQKGAMYTPSSVTEDDLSDEELMDMVNTTDSLHIADSTAPALIVIPANLDANINFRASNAIYDKLIADTITAKIVMKERCVQITETKAQTNMGEITFDAFYSTRSKKDLKAGFDLNFKDITADKAISLMPTIDTLMPILKSFSGNLNCEIAATTALDTNMNLITPSINGIMRISGDELTITGNDIYRSLAKKFMLKNKKEGHIENMKMEAVIKDNTLEVFPFVISMDRYMLAMSGIQNLDMSYRYHASVIKSPLPVKLGIDVYGPDFDNMKFKIGKAKYRSSEVPVFSSVIEETKINLLKAIRNIFEKGVDATINENIRQSAILDEHKQKIGYVRAVDMQIEELSEKEQKEMDNAQKSEEIETSEENK